jgi:hypothetical protein
MQHWDARPTGRQIAARAYKSSIAAAGAMPLLFLSTLAVIVVLYVANLEANKLLPVSLADAARWKDRPFTNLLPLQALALVALLLNALVMAPLAVAVHRFILLGEVETRALPLTAPHTKEFAAWIFALQLVQFVLGQQQFLPSPWNIVTAVLPFLLAVLCIWLTMVFPATAVGAPADGWRMRVRTSIGQVKGNFWLLVRSTILTLAPLLLLAIIPFFLLTVARGIPFGDERAAYAVLDWRYALLSAPLNIALIALMAAAASWLYAWVAKRA